VTALKGLIVVAAVALGALFAFGSVVAALFEVRGFGRDEDPRLGYLFLLALGFAGSVGIPWLLWRLLLPTARRAGSSRLSRRWSASCSSSGCLSLARDRRARERVTAAAHRNLKPLARPNVTAAITSATPAQRTITADG
jgi:hypothetical protein